MYSSSTDYSQDLDDVEVRIPVLCWLVVQPSSTILKSYLLIDSSLLLYFLISYVSFFGILCRISFFIMLLNLTDWTNSHYCC